MRSPTRTHNPARRSPLASRIIAVVLLGFTCGANAAGSLAQPETGTPGLQPADQAEVFVQVRGLADQLKSPQGRAARDMIGSLGLFDRTASSWNALSESLGLSSDEAVDALLAGRFTLLADNVEGDAPVWACVMTIDPAVGARIPKTLKAAPRGALQGRTVYAIEDGRLTVMPIGRDGRVLALASRGGDSLLAACAQIASSWPRIPDGRDNPRGGPGAVVMVRPTDGSVLSGTVTPKPGGWDFGFVAHGGALGTPTAETPATAAAIDNNWYDAITTDAAVSYAGPLRASRAERPAGSGWRFDDLPRIAAAFMPIAPPDAFMAGESDFGLLVNRGDGDGSMWFRVQDAARAAKLGDAHVCDLLGNLPEAGLISGDSPECTGVFPGAGRRIAIPVSNAAAGERVGLSWGTRRFAAMGGLADTRMTETWWAMQSVGGQHGGIVPTDTPRFVRSSDGAYLRFTIRPARFLGDIAGMGQAADLPPVGPLAAVGRVRLLDCSLERDGTGGTNGLARIRLDAAD